MKKKISLLMALIMLLGCFSMLTFPTSAETEYTYLVENTDYRKYLNWIGTQKINSLNPFSGTVELDENGIADFAGWLTVNGGVSGYKYSVDGGELVDVKFPYIYNPSISSAVPGYDQAAYDTAGISFSIDLSGYEAGKTHTIKLYAVCKSDPTKLCEMLNSKFNSAYFGYDLIDNYTIQSWEPNDDTNVGNENEKADAIITLEKTSHRNNIKGISGDLKFGLFISSESSARSRQFFTNQLDFSKYGSIVFTYMTNYTSEGSSIQVLNANNLVFAELPIVPTTENLTYRQGIAATEKTAVMDIKSTVTTTAPRWYLNTTETTTNKYVVVNSIKLLSVSYDTYLAALANVQAAEASVDAAIKACDGLNFWAKDAADAQKMLDTIVRSSLNNENVAVSYANGAIANNKYTVDVTYTVEGESYTDKVEVAISEKAVVGAQSRNNNDDTYGVRFLATIDDYTAYDEIGFEIVADYDAGIYAETDKTYDTECYEVFDSVLSLEDGTTVMNSAGDFHGNYLMALTINGIPTNTGSAGFTVRAYYVAKGSSERIYTDTVSFDAINGEIVDN